MPLNKISAFTLNSAVDFQKDIKEKAMSKFQPTPAKDPNESAFSPMKAMAAFRNNSRRKNLASRSSCNVITLLE